MPREAVPEPVFLPGAGLCAVQGSLRCCGPPASTMPRLWMLKPWASARPHRSRRHRSSDSRYDRLLVGEHSRQEVARRAGVDSDYVDRLVELGLLQPGTGDVFSPGDVRRARWVQSLERAGVPLDGMAAAVRDGALSFSFLDVTAFDRFAGLSGTTFRELSERTGVPLELLNVVREAVGFAEPRPEDHVREDELSVVSAIELQLSSGFRPVVIERWLRVLGDGLARIAETETDWWRSEVGIPLLESGMTEGEMLEAQADLGSRMAPPLRAGPPRHLPRAAGTRLEQERRRGR
jgi:hypothetical protein